MENARISLEISGVVQGVFYRLYTKRKADEIGVTGWVKNLPRGSVKIVAEGPNEKLTKFIKWCWDGSPSAQVSDIRVEWQDYEGEYSIFKIRY